MRESESEKRGKPNSWGEKRAALQRHSNGSNAKSMAFNVCRVLRAAAAAVV